MRHAIIGANCIIGQNVFIGEGVVIGDNVKIQNNVSIYKGVEIADHAFIGPSVVFTNILNPRSFIERKSKFMSTYVKKGATIGANSTIICGNEIGKFAMVGAGSIVSSDIDDFVLAYGQPAKKVSFISEVGFKLEFDHLGKARCIHSDDLYVYAGGKVKKYEE